MRYNDAMKKLILSLLFITLFACSSGEKTFQTIEGKTMGTYYKVSLYTSEKPADLKQEIDKFLVLFNKIFSNYIVDSEISRINQAKFDSVKMSKSMRKVLELSLDISRKSYGYFDITVAPLVKAWGFGPDGSKLKPTKEEVQTILGRVGHEKLKIEDERLKKPVGLAIDLSAIAKGFGVDELVKFLEFRGYGSLLVEIGGEVRTRGNKQDGSSWRVGIEGPGKELGAKIVKVVPLKDMSMATSGSYRNYVKYGDEIFNHMIDPMTGFPVKHKTISVSVLSEYCADADAWATALMSMGAEKGLDLANKFNLAALFQVKEGDKVKELISTEFEKLIKK